MRRGDDDGGKPTTKLHRVEIAGLIAESVPPISDFTKPRMRRPELASTGSDVASFCALSAKMKPAGVSRRHFA